MNFIGIFKITLIIILVLINYIGCQKKIYKNPEINSTNITIKIALGDSIDNNAYHEPAEIVSMISLIANPEKYHGKIIRVVGYLYLEFESNGIYFHKEDFDKGTFNGFWVSIPLNYKTPYKKLQIEFNHKYVIIQGTFDMNDKGHLGDWYGSIKYITSIELRKFN
ncbi:MAG: hypothetical protein M1419_00975 [Bacteroidetes bacterium]|nr:hypothetical protein [Bacteroidota bacterium]